MKSLALKIDGHILSQTSADFDIEEICELLNEHGFKFIGSSDLIDWDDDDKDDDDLTEIREDLEDIGDDIK